CSRFFFFQAEDGIRDRNVTGVQTCALPISSRRNEKVKRRVLSALLTCSLTLTAIAAPSVVLAEDFDQQLEQKNKEISDLQGQQRSEERRVGKGSKYREAATRSTKKYNI